MKIKVNTDENGYLLNYAIIGDVENSIEVEIADDFDGIDYRCYKIENGLATFDLNMKAQITEEIFVRDIRLRREAECFRIINRGGLWYDLLTSQEKDELLHWYLAWLDAGETRLVPDMPKWLK